MQDIWHDCIVPQEKYSALNILNLYFSKYKMRGHGWFPNMATNVKSYFEVLP